MMFCVADFKKEKLHRKKIFVTLEKDLRGPYTWPKLGGWGLRPIRTKLNLQLGLWKPTNKNPLAKRLP